MIAFWDIENIAYDIALKKINSFNLSKKIFVHNEKYIPLKENKRNNLLNTGWEYISVKNGKNASDDKLISLIEKEFDNYQEFVLITQDHIFSNIIIRLLKAGKKVYLITNGKEEKLLRKIEREIGSHDNLIL